MKKVLCLVLSLVMVVSFNACSMIDKNSQSASQPGVATDVEGRGKESGEFSKDLLEIPEEYFEPVDSSTPSQEISYTHDDHTKTAVVYLPPNYNENEKYNFMYILGGVSSDQTAFFNNAGDEATLKNIIDNMIINGDIQPCIIVNMAFYPTPDITFGDVEMSELLDDFSYELLNIVIPQVEGTYSSYANSTSKEDLIASRKHRAMAGFSMGGATTWYQLSTNLEYFYYYVPMAASSFENYQAECQGAIADPLTQLLDNSQFTNEDFFVFACEGTEDVTYEKMEELIGNFKKYYPDLFVFTDDNKATGNITYKTKKGAKHEYKNAYQYLYNALFAIW